jgi:hypothetical protein
MSLDGTFVSDLTASSNDRFAPKAVVRRSNAINFDPQVLISFVWSAYQWASDSISSLSLSVGELTPLLPFPWQSKHWLHFVDNEPTPFRRLVISRASSRPIAGPPSSKTPLKGHILQVAFQRRLARLSLHRGDRSRCGRYVDLDGARGQRDLLELLLSHLDDGILVERVAPIGEPIPTAATKPPRTMTRKLLVGNCHNTRKVRLLPTSARGALRLGGTDFPMSSVGPPRRSNVPASFSACRSI